MNKLQVNLFIGHLMYQATLEETMLSVNGLGFKPGKSGLLNLIHDACNYRWCENHKAINHQYLNLRFVNKQNKKLGL